MINNLINTIYKITSCFSRIIEKLDSKTLALTSLISNILTLIGLLLVIFLTDDVSSIEHPSVIKVEVIDTSTESGTNPEKILSLEKKWKVNQKSGI